MSRFSYAFIFRDYNDTAIRAVAQNASSSRKNLGSLSAFSTVAKTKQLVGTLAIIPVETLQSKFEPLPNNHALPVFVNAHGFGAGMAEFRKKGRSGTDATYAIRKKSLDSVEPTNPRYFGNYYEVHAKDIVWRGAGVDSITFGTGTNDPGTIGFVVASADRPSQLLTINQVRGLANTSAYQQELAVAVRDVVLEYPDKLGFLLTPGQVKWSDELRTARNTQTGTPFGNMRSDIVSEVDADTADADADENEPDDASAAAPAPPAAPAAPKAPRRWM